MSYVYRDVSSGEVYFYDDDGHRWVIAQTKKVESGVQPPSGGGAVGLSFTERVNYRAFTEVPGQADVYLHGKRLENQLPARSLLNAVRVRTITPFNGHVYTLSGSATFDDFEEIGGPPAGPWQQILIGTGGYGAGQPKPLTVMHSAMIDITTAFEPVHASSPLQVNAFMFQRVEQPQVPFGGGEDAVWTPDIFEDYTINAEVAETYAADYRQSASVHAIPENQGNIYLACVKSDNQAATWDPTAGALDWEFKTRVHPQDFGLQIGVPEDGSDLAPLGPVNSVVGLRTSEDDFITPTLFSAPTIASVDRYIWLTARGWWLDPKWNSLSAGEIEVTVWYSPLP
jgi:hypothetical protein